MTTAGAPALKTASRCPSPALIALMVRAHVNLVVLASLAIAESAIQQQGTAA
ncbi:hypothetical protein KCP73_11260 [Salmonella enterica subsp. enterica]|nr:hypothetical protein KCP73_11260 [Salmonella enterica subsp. enterica]